MRRIWIGGLGIALVSIACVRDRDVTGGLTADEMQCEIKVTLPPEQIADAMHELGLDDAAASPGTLWFFDSRKLELFEKGVILRERRIAGEGDKSTVKVRPMGASVAVPKWLEVHGFKREEDFTGTREVVSWGLTAKTEKGAIEAVVAGTRAIEMLFDSAQQKLLADCSPVPIDWASLVSLGPIETKRWSFHYRGQSGAFDRQLSAERWVLPDGTDLFEVSTRVPATEAGAAQKELLEHLESLGLSLSRRQETKTRVALEYFSAH